MLILAIREMVIKNSCTQTKVKNKKLSHPNLTCRRQALLTISFSMNTHHWNLHSGCPTPGQPLWNCWRCGTDCPVQQGTAACSAGCWMLGTAGTSQGHSPPGRLYSVPADQGDHRSSALPALLRASVPQPDF